MIGCNVLTAVLALSATGSFLPSQTSEQADLSGHTASFVRVAPEATLEVLDWGGNGPPLIFLSGLGNTSHIFDHFAHQFTDRFRVMAVTRRGYGASTHPSTGYDLATRARDLLAVLDELHLETVIMVGHSIAGDEVTKFAATYPTRIRALVYLDAAYDRTKVKDLPQPASPEPSADTYTSVEKFTAYLARFWNWRAPLAETYNTRVVSSDGRVGERRTAPEIPAQIVKLLERPEYNKVKALALALYARPDLRNVYPYHADFDAESQRRADQIIATSREYQEEAIADFRAHVQNGRVVVLDGNHYLFITNETDVVRLLRNFLAESLR